MKHGVHSTVKRVCW